MNTAPIQATVNLVDRETTTTRSVWELRADVDVSFAPTKREAARALAAALLDYAGQLDAKAAGIQRPSLRFRVEMADAIPAVKPPKEEA